MDFELEKLFYDNVVEKVRTIKYKYCEGVRLVENFFNTLDSIENFEVRDDDVWVCSFPKTGTTWTQEMVWCIANDLDFEAAKVGMIERFPFLEDSNATTLGNLKSRERNQDDFVHASGSVEFCNGLPSPRFIKSHLPFNLLPRQLRTGEKKAKIIYVARNPKDTCISYYHHYKLIEGYCGTFENFCKLFLGNKVSYAPFWEHIIGYWEKKNEENILFLKYENMKADLPSVIKKTAAFLGKTLTAQNVEALTEHLSFASMKSNPAVNLEKDVELYNELKLFGERKLEGSFIRSGTSGQWKTAMSEKFIKQFDQWTADKLRNYSDLEAEFS